MGGREHTVILACSRVKGQETETTTADRIIDSGHYYYY